MFVNHGDPESCESFAKCLNEEHGLNAFAPYSGTEFDLREGRFTVITEGKPVTKLAAAGGERKPNPLFSELVSAAQKLVDAVKKCEGRPNRELRGIIDSINNLIKRING